VSEGCGQRSKNARVAIGYGVRLSVAIDKATQLVILKPSNVHNHDLDMVDKVRQSQGMKAVARQQVSYGYSPATVLEAIRGQSGRFPGSLATLVNTGGQHISRHTIRHAGKATLEAHPDERLDNNDATWI